MLAKLLSNDDGHVRSIAARSIAQLNIVESVPKLMRLLTDPYEDVQEAAVDALSVLRQLLQLQELFRMLSAEDSVLRRNAARLLGKIEATEAVKELGFGPQGREDFRQKGSCPGHFPSIGTDEAMRYLTACHLPTRIRTSG